MTKQELLNLMRLLSAMESAMLCSGKSVPDYLIESLNDQMLILEREILK